MARAATDPAFRHDLARIRRLEAGGRIPQGSARECLRCHSPLAYFAAGAAEEVAREGVTCVVCHGVSGFVEREPEKPRFRLDLSTPVLYGAARRGVSRSNAPHPVEKSPVVGTSELCMMCHHDTPQGAPNELLWIEYRESRYAAQGIRCQDCHMKQPQPHRFPGGHADSPLLPGVATLELELVGETEVRVRVENVGAGHHFPPRGAHENSLDLVLEILDGEGRPVESARRQFRYAFVDAYGRPQELNRATAPIAGVRDTTLPPRRPREEIVRFGTLRPGHRVRARLVYALVPEYRQALYPQSDRLSLRPTTVAERILPVAPTGPSGR